MMLWTGAEQPRPPIQEDAVELMPPVRATGIEERALPPDLTGAQRSSLDSIVEQPHLREGRPPFWPTHAAREAMEGMVDWQPGRHLVMAIEGYGYTPAAWEAGQAPRYDIDRTGAWYDLEAGCGVPLIEHPEALPPRYGMWRDADGAPHLMVAEDGVLTQIAVETTVTDALLTDLVADIAHGSDAAERLAAACTELSTDVRELSVSDVEDLLRGDLDAPTPYTWTPDALGIADRGGVDSSLTRSELSVAEPAAPSLVTVELQTAIIDEPAADLSDALWDF